MIHKFFFGTGQLFFHVFFHVFILMASTSQAIQLTCSGILPTHSGAATASAQWIAPQKGGAPSMAMAAM